MKTLTRDDTRHGCEYYDAAEVDDELVAYTQLLAYFKGHEAAAAALTSSAFSEGMAAANRAAFNLRNVGV